MNDELNTLQPTGPWTRFDRKHAAIFQTRVLNGRSVDRFLEADLTQVNEIIRRCKNNIFAEKIKYESYFVNFADQ